MLKMMMATATRNKVGFAPADLPDRVGVFVMRLLYAHFDNKNYTCHKNATISHRFGPIRRAGPYRPALLIYLPGIHLLGSHLFLLAFHAHRFELTLFGVVRFLNLSLDLGCRLLQLR
jgi:hypothetical protein